MSFFKKLLGGTFESNRDQGEEMFEKCRFGEAKISFERALTKKSKEVDEASVKAVKDKITQCRLELARTRLAQAAQEVKDGDPEAALELLTEAKEICDDPDIALQVVSRRKEVEAAIVRMQYEDDDELSEEELLNIIAGTWTEEQADEFAALPEEFMEAMLASHDNDHQRAKEILTTLTRQSGLAVEPKYVWFELARELWSDKNNEDAVEAFAKFLKMTDGDEKALPIRISAISIQVSALTSLKRYDEAKEQLLQATKLAPESHRVFLSLGIFLRSRNELEGSYKALLKASELMGTMQPDFAVIRELGFTCIAMERFDEAAGHLGSVIEHQASTGKHDEFDPETAIALARLHEQRNEYVKAADLYRHLAQGNDAGNYFFYNLEAARLLKLCGERQELIERYLARSEELAETREQREAVQKALA